MSALGGVVVAKRSDRTPPRPKVEMVGVDVGDGLWAEVTRSTSKDIVLEIPFEAWVFFAECVQGFSIELMKLRSE